MFHKQRRSLKKFMNNLNSILIEGNLVKDPAIRSTVKGTQLCTFKIATNRFYKLHSQDPGFEREVSFFDVETWAKLAELCYTKGKKGRGLRVVGRLKQSRWNDVDGKPRSRVTIIAEHVEFRPEFKKEEKSIANMEDTYASEDAYVTEDEYPSSDVYDDEDNKCVSMIKDKEIEAVVF